MRDSRSIFFEPEPVGAAAAERFGDAPLRKPLPHGAGSRTRQDFSKCVEFQVSQGGHPVMVQTARDDRAIHEDRKLVFESRAVPVGAEIRCRETRPFKAFRGIDVEGV